MLSLLLVLCAVVAVGVIIQINRGGNDADGSTDAFIDAGQPDGDTDVIGSIDINNIPRLPTDLNNDYLQYPRALVKQADTDYWLFYPDLPEGTKPGDMVVLNASAFGFIAWEADPDYADVELFGQVFDDGQVFVSLIVPDEQFAIRALYDDMYISGHVPQEQGAYSTMAAVPLGITLMPDGTVRTSSGGVLTTYPRNTPVPLPDGMVGEDYEQIIRSDFNTFAIDAYWNIIGGVINIPGMTSDLPAAGTPPTGTTPGFTQATISGPATSAGADTFTIRVTPYKWEQDLEDEDDDGEYVPDTANTIDYNFTLRILPKPSIDSRSPLPDGMENFIYRYEDMDGNDITITASNITTSDFTWRVSPATDDILPPGFPVFSPRTEIDLENSKARAYINFVPSTARATPYEFYIELWYTGTSAFIPTTTPIVSKDFSIMIWERPKIAARDLPAGIHAWPYKYEPGTTPADLTISTTSIPVPGGTWDWFIEGMPTSGIGIYKVSNTAARLAGENPSVRRDASGQVEVDEDGVVLPYNFTAVLYSDNPNMFREVTGYSGMEPQWQEFSISENFSVRIWPEPEFITDQSELQHAMDWRRLYPNEPKDDTELWIIEGEYPQGMEIVWDWTLEGDLPTGASTSYAPETAAGQEIKFEQKFPGLAHITGNPQTDASEKFRFIVIMKANIPNNLNIHEKEVPEGYFIQMWLRRYLHIDISPTMGLGFVTRRGELGDVNWSQFDMNDAINRPYRTQRAVMPGTQGEIVVRRSPFVLWELIGIGDPYLVGKDNANNLVNMVNVGSMVNGNGTERGWWTSTDHSHLATRMPDYNSGGTEIDKDIYMRGTWVRDPRTMITASLPQGTVDVPYTEGNVSLPARDECSHQLINSTLPAEDRIECTCPSRNVLWGERDVPGILPSFGLHLEDIDIRTARIVSEDGPTRPTDPANPTSINFTLTLRGSMVIERSFPIVIIPKPGPFYGDVDGNGIRDLRDLVLLMLVEQGMTPPPNFVFVNADVDGNGRIDSNDVRILARFFARPRATLPLEQQP